MIGAGNCKGFPGRYNRIEQTEIAVPNAPRNDNRSRFPGRERIS